MYLLGNNVSIQYPLTVMMCTINRITPGIIKLLR